MTDRATGRGTGATRTGAWCVLFLILLASAPVWGQSRGRVVGTVTDAATGEALPGVNVVVVGEGVGTATGADGDYSIANLQVGTYDVRATAVGFDTLTVTGVRVGPGLTTRVDVALYEQARELGGEVVVGAERPLVERDNTASVVRLGAREIAAIPTTDLAWVLTTLPSVDVVDGEIRIRGRTLDEVAFLVDGARSRDPLTNDPYTRINLGAIAELEVITGGYNAEYGEAQSGVINVITKEGRRDRYEAYLDGRYTPPGLRHFGTAFYDRSSPLLWENTHALHPEWWVENPDQWVDPLGNPGSSAASTWTPEQAYQHYLDTHQPLTDYTGTPTYQVELGGGGPLGLSGATFFGTLKYRSEAPLFGNAYRDVGAYLDGNLTVAVPLGRGMRLVGAGFYGSEATGWGYYNDYFWASTYGARARYAFYDFAGLPYERTDGQTLRFSHLLSAATLYELRVARVNAVRRVSPFPDDPLGFEAAGPTESLIQSSDPDGDHGDPVGFNTTGYYFRYDDRNTEWAFQGDLSSQLNPFLALKTGLEFSAYTLRHNNVARPPLRADSAVYTPYQGAAFVQSKVEFGGLIVNAGLRLDVYNPHDSVYVDIFDPLGPDAERQPTRLFAQLSPRLGISHPIDSRTVLHFSYGHFFQRPPFNQYGEGIAEASGSLNTVIAEDGSLSVLGNRNLRPQQTIAFEVGIERSFWDRVVLDVTAYYKDIRHTINTVAVRTNGGGLYYTNVNGGYADVRGVELGLRQVPTTYPWGTVSGYASFTAAIGILGRSVALQTLTPDGPIYGGSGDVIEHSNPFLKFGVAYGTPPRMHGLAGALLRGWWLSFAYSADLPNDQISSDYFVFEGRKHLRDWDRQTALRLDRTISLPGGRGEVSPYVEVQNVFNDRWVFLQAVERASPEDQRLFVESGFRDLPERDSDGVPILDVGLYRNLPRSVVFGVTFTF